MNHRIILLISAICLGIAYFISIPDNKIRMVFCDVGQGDGAIIMQGTNQLVIDVGPENRKMVECLGRYLPFWDKKIEGVIITHADRDHGGGLEQVKRSYRVQQIYSGELRQNDIVKLGDIVFEVVSPQEKSGDDNKDSVVGIVGAYSNAPILMVADAPAEVEQKLVWRRLVGNGLKPFLTVLKVAHHGSAEGTSKELLEAVKPKLAIISVGKNNKFGHPNGEVLARLKGIEIKRTDVDGDIVVELF